MNHGQNFVITGKVTTIYMNSSIILYRSQPTFENVEITALPTCSEFQAQNIGNPCLMKYTKLEIL